MRYIFLVYDDDSGRRYFFIELVKNLMLYFFWGFLFFGYVIKYVCLCCIVLIVCMNVIYLCSEFLGNLIIVIYKNNLILRFLKFCNGYFFFIFYLIKLMSGYLLCF